MKIKISISLVIFPLFLILLLLSNLFADSILVNEYISSPVSASSTTKYGSISGDSYISKIQSIEGNTRMRGMIITDGVAAPTCYINQLVGGTNTAQWHGTDTVAFIQIGSLWRGEIDFPIFGRFTRASINGFGNANFFSMNWFVTNVSGREIATKWIDSVTVIGTTTTQLAPQSSSRKYILIVNEGTSNDLYVSGNTPIATSTSGIIVAKNKGYWEESSGKFYDSIYAVTSSGTTTVRITELK